MKKTLIIVALLMAAIQFIPATQENPAIDEQMALKPPEEVETLLKRACYDCHTNQTEWPAYSKIAPASFLITSNVNNGRKAINFSKYENIEKRIREERLKRASHLIKLDHMPPASYRMMHEEANLNLDEMKMLIHYFEGLLEEEKNQKTLSM